MLETLAAAPLPTAPDTPRRALHLGLYQFGDAFGGLAEGLVAGKWLEFRGRWSEQLLTAYTEEGAALRSIYETRRRWAGLEVASYFVSSRSESGRVGLEFLHAMPSGEDFLKLSFQTALLPRPDRPWRFVLETAYFFPFKKTVGDTLSMRLSIDRQGESEWSVGGTVAVTYRMGPLGPPGVYEIAMISAGPLLRYRGFTAGLAVRAFLDKRVEASGTMRNVSGLRPPDVYLGWDLR